MYVHKTPYQLFRTVRDGTRWRSPSIVFSVWKRSLSVETSTHTCLPRASRFGDTVPDGLEAWSSVTPTAQYITYNIKKWGCLTTCVVQRKRPQHFYTFGCEVCYVLGSSVVRWVTPLDRGRRFVGWIPKVIEKQKNTLWSDRSQTWLRKTRKRLRLRRWIYMTNSWSWWGGRP